MSILEIIGIIILIGIISLIVKKMYQKWLIQKRRINNELKKARKNIGTTFLLTTLTGEIKVIVEDVELSSINKDRLLYTTRDIKNPLDVYQLYININK